MNSWIAGIFYDAVLSHLKNLDYTPPGDGEGESVEVVVLGAPPPQDRLEPRMIWLVGASDADDAASMGPQDEVRTREDPVTITGACLALALGEGDDTATEARTAVIALAGAIDHLMRTTPQLGISSDTAQVLAWRVTRTLEQGLWNGGEFRGALINWSLVITTRT